MAVEQVLQATKVKGVIHFALNTFNTLLGSIGAEDSWAMLRGEQRQMVLGASEALKG